MNLEVIAKELEFKAIRSSGPGGQHANKVASKVQLSFNITLSEGLTDSEKNRVHHKLQGHISKEGVLQLSSESSRSQHKNKEIVTERFFELLKKALHVAKKRKPTKPSKSAVEKRLKMKGLVAKKKDNRQKPNLD